MPNYEGLYANALQEKIRLRTRLAAIEQQVQELADEEMEAARYTKKIDPERAYRQRCRARRLRAIIDAPDAGGEG